MAQAILTLNAGSSSLKFALFASSDDDRLDPVMRGGIDEIPTRPRFAVRDKTGAMLADEAWPEVAGDFASLFDRTLGWIEARVGANPLTAVGHRVVHGGADYFRPQTVDPDIIEALERLTPLAPLHQPQNVAAIRAIAAARPGLPQVACFDTAFHHGMPAVATRFALPRVYEAMGVRRYGFHGLSYEFIAGRLHEIAPALAGGRVIVAHLGNGASLCAMSNGKSIDTTMGFSALDGLVMGTRPGNLDPGVILYLLQQRSMTVRDLQELLYRRSGLLGVSGGISSDMRELLASSDPRAAEAVELFAYRIAREMGALAGALGGIDGVVFTAGIGEHAPPVRAAVCARLKWLGVVLDPDANKRGEAVISAGESRIQVRVMATDEETMIARHTVATIRRLRRA